MHDPVQPTKWNAGLGLPFAGHRLHDPVQPSHMLDLAIEGPNKRKSLRPKEDIIANVVLQILGHFLRMPKTTAEVKEQLWNIIEKICYNCTHQTIRCTQHVQSWCLVMSGKRAVIACLRFNRDKFNLMLF